MNGYSPFIPGIRRHGEGISPRPMSHFDHFSVGGYVPDAALSNESDPGAKFSEVADRGEWLVTRDVAPTIVIADDAPGGVLAITTGSNANDFVSLQLNGEAFKPQAGKNILFECRFKLDDVDDAMWFVGLATTDVTGNTRGPVLDGTTNSIGFRNVVGTTANVHYVVENATTETTDDSGIDLANDTWIIAVIEVIGTEKVLFFLSSAANPDQKVATVKNNIPANDPLTLTLEVSATTASSVLSVDYIGGHQDV